MKNIEKFIKKYNKNVLFLDQVKITRKLDELDTLLNCGFCPAKKECPKYIGSPGQWSCLMIFLEWGMKEND